MKEIILASASARRTRILQECGLAHRIVVSDVPEDMDKSKSIEDIVKINARNKAETVAKKEKEAIVIGADTLVAHGEDILGKPTSKDDAKSMLRNFSGTDIEVYTGLCVASGGKIAIACDRSDIQVASLTSKEIDEYFDLLGPYDKAGGFSIEGVGSLIFDEIKGSYFNILGLSMMKLRELFNEIGEDILCYINV